jgi:hypothetical protein
MAWRYWNWDPSNDRDFIGLPVTTISANPSKQRQWTQELRYADDLSPTVGFVLGGFGFYQTIRSRGKQEQGGQPHGFSLPPPRSRRRQACWTDTARPPIFVRLPPVQPSSVSSSGRSPNDSDFFLGCDSTTTRKMWTTTLTSTADYKRTTPY